MLNVLFSSMNVSESQQKTILPAYLLALGRCDFDILIDTLTDLMETWDTGKLPSAPQIIQQYKLHKYKIQQRNQLKHNPEPGAITAASNFWTAYKQCKEAGVDNIQAIAKYLEKSVKQDFKHFNQEA